MRIIDIIQNIQSIYSKGVASDDTRLRRRLVYNKMISVRGQLLSQSRNKKQKISPFSYQEMEILVEPYNPGDKRGLSSCNNELSKSVNKIPSILSDMDNLIIDFVGSEDGSTIFDRVNSVGAKYTQGNKYTGQKYRYYIKDNDLYLVGNRFLKSVVLNAVFIDPLEVYPYDITVPHYERDFPIDSKLIDSLQEMVVAELLSKFTGMREDNTNNGRDDRETE